MNSSVLFIGRVEQAPMQLADADKHVVRFSLSVRDVCFCEPRFIEVRSSDEIAERALATLKPGRELAAQGNLAISAPFRDEIGGLIRKPFVELKRFHPLYENTR